MRNKLFIKVSRILKRVIITNKTMTNNKYKN